MKFLTDKIGMFTSVLCLIHCIAFPLLFSILPTLQLIDEPFEWVLLIIAFIVGGWSMFDNMRKHKYVKSMIFFVSGFLIIGASLYTDMHWLNWFGLSFLVTAHFLNWKFIREVDGCHPHNCKH